VASLFGPTLYTVLQKIIPPNFNDNFNTSDPIPLIFGIYLVLPSYYWAIVVVSIVVAAEIVMQ